MLLKLYEENPNPKDVQKAVDVLKSGGVVIYPTDTIYAIGCDIYNNKAVERVALIKGISPKKAQFSFVCHDLKHLSDYTKFVDNQVYKLMNRNLPGPFTFILHANKNVPKHFRSKKKTVGIRVPDNAITSEIVRFLGNPVVSTSIHDNDEIIEYTTDPELIYERYENQVDLVIDGGYGKNEPSTVVDCTGDEIEILRQGLGDLEE